MGQTILSEHLAPPPVGQARTYAVHTHFELQLPGRQLTQQSAALLRLTVLEAAPTGYLLELTTLELRTAAAAAPLGLPADIARLNSPLHLRTDAHGALLRVANKPALAAQWQQALPWLQAKYHALPGATALLGQVARQYRDDNEQLEQALAHRGPGAVLLPGYWGLHSWQGDTRQEGKTVQQALGPVALPLRVQWTADPAPDPFAPSLEVHGLGQLDRSCFDAAASQQFLETLRGGNWTGPPAPLNVWWREQYTVGRLGQGLLAGRQSLRVAVDQLYFADITHTVRPAASLAPA